MRLYRRTALMRGYELFPLKEEGGGGGGGDYVIMQTYRYRRGVTHIRTAGGLR